MSSACNHYLDNAQDGHEDYQYELERLRASFSGAVGSLGKTEGVVVQEPGAECTDALPPSAGHLARSN